MTYGMIGVFYFYFLDKDEVSLKTFCKKVPRSKQIIKKYCLGNFKKKCLGFCPPDAFQKEMAKYWGRIR